MRTCIVITAALLLAAVVVASPAGEKYNNRYDHVDIDSILRNERNLKVYVNCLLEKGDCPPEAKELRAHIPEALRTNCEKCTPSQKNLLRKAIRYLRDNKRPVLDQITQHYDPEAKFRKQFAEFVNSDN